MERRDFLKLTFGIAGGAAALAASAQAAPLMPQPLAKDERLSPAAKDAHPALTTEEEVNRLKPEDVRWWRHRGWRHRHWRRWHRRYW
jgi:hypothetical protein